MPMQRASSEADANCPASPLTDSLVLPISPLISFRAFCKEVASPENVNVTSAMSGQVFQSVEQARRFSGFIFGDASPFGSNALAEPCGMQVLQGLAERHPHDVFLRPPRRFSYRENHGGVQRGVCPFGESVESGCGMADAACNDAWSADNAEVMTRSSAGLILMANWAALRFTCDGVL